MALFRFACGRRAGRLARDLSRRDEFAARPTRSARCCSTLTIRPACIARSREPILRPEAPYEREGFFGGVVFTCGLLADGDSVRIYYGAADGVTAVADLSLDDILGGLA